MESVMVPLAPQNVVMSALRRSPLPNRRFSERTTWKRSMASTHKKRVARSTKVSPKTSRMSVEFVMRTFSHVSCMARGSWVPRSTNTMPFRA